MTKTVSIIGLGWLGLPLAERLLKAGFQVIGSVTTPEKRDALQQRPIEVHRLQLNPEPDTDLRPLLKADTLLINVPPKAGKLGDDFHPAQVAHLAKAINQSSIQHIIYVSSTSVYPDLSRVVVEEDVTSTQNSAATGLSQAEQTLQNLTPERLLTVVRCGGLMGYNRIPAKYVAGRTVDSGAVPVNYLHRDDAVEILLIFIQHPASGVFNAVAPKHPDRRSVYQKSCLDFGYSLPTFVQPDEPIPYKIVSPEKLIQATQYTFIYPDPLHFYYKQTEP